eukprot:TRINITY_DN2519_c0_g1_i1.p1 TRINITY_DN2519_c0_g1~~TRINITY_DN2519_c0_g1_i1.p1  ORF type:complete len:198 (-),score=37.50 TRINITY_DN2519_c0_g1_i1:17-610(-)
MGIRYCVGTDNKLSNPMIHCPNCNRRFHLRCCGYPMRSKSGDHLKQLCLECRGMAPHQRYPNVKASHPIPHDADLDVYTHLLRENEEENEVTRHESETDILSTLDTTSRSSLPRTGSPLMSKSAEAYGNAISTAVRSSRRSSRKRTRTSRSDAFDDDEDEYDDFVDDDEDENDDFDGSEGELKFLSSTRVARKRTRY